MCTFNFNPDEKGLPIFILSIHEWLAKHVNGLGATVSVGIQARPTKPIPSWFVNEVLELTE